MPQTLGFDIGLQHASLEVDDDANKESFIHWLRQQKEVAAVSSDGNQLVVELDRYCVPIELTAKIRRHYPRLKVSPFRKFTAPHPR